MLAKKGSIAVLAYVRLGDDGATTHLLEQWSTVSKLSDRKIHLFLPQPNTERINEYKKMLSGIELHWIPLTNRKGGPASTIISMMFFEVLGGSRILRYLKKNPGTIFYNRVRPFNWGAITAQRARPPAVHEVNGIISEEIKATYPLPGIFSWLNSSIEKKGYKNAKAIISVTGQISKHVKKITLNSTAKHFVIPNGVNLNLFQHVVEDNEQTMRASIRKQLRIDPDEEVIIFVGYLAAWQDMNTLLLSAKEIFSARPNAKLIIVGPGDKKDLEKHAKNIGISNKIIFTGRVPYNNVPAYIQASDVCVAPFTSGRNIKTGLSPLKIYEYMACGKPVVSSQVPGVAEAITEAKAGKIVEPENPRALSEAVCQILENKSMQREMGENGRAFVEKNCGWGSVAKKIIDICNIAVSPAD